MEKEKKEIRLSPTACITYTRCPREFYYSYVLRLPTPPSIHLVKGNVVHKVLELFYKVYKPGLADTIVNLFNACWEERSEEIISLNMEKEELEKHKVDCLDMLNLYMTTTQLKLDGLIRVGKAENERHAFYLMKPKYKELWIEDTDLNLCGYIDRIHTDWDGTTTIGDYKTSGRFGIGIKDEYELQCGIYALLYNRKFGKNTDYTSIIYVRYGEEVRTRVTPTQVSEALKTVLHVRENCGSTEKEDYATKEGKFCKWCNHFSKCSGQEEVNAEIRQKKVLKEMGK